MLGFCGVLVLLLVTTTQVYGQDVACPGQQTYGEECPRKCEEGNFAPPTCTPVMGCHCPSNLYINRDGNCVTINECLFENAQILLPPNETPVLGLISELVQPDVDCPGGRTFYCGSCEIFCELRNEVETCLPNQPGCQETCWCPPGTFVRYSDAQCVPPEECPIDIVPIPPTQSTTTTSALPTAPRTLPPSVIPTNPPIVTEAVPGDCEMVPCLSHCQRTCANRLANVLCDRYQCVPGCVCPDLNKFLLGNRCVDLVECPPLPIPDFYCGFCPLDQECYSTGDSLFECR